jgi:hypothetical protein
MNIRVERIKLKRLGQKVWQFRDCEPKRVELAVLDYLASKGWRGYFTEHFDYNTTILCMMLWCNRESYYKEKRKTSEIFKSSRPAWYAFNYASDGFFFNKHKFSHKNLMEHATSFSEEVIPRILEVWKDRKIKSPIFGKAYLKPRSANELSEEFLVSYFKARGGLQYYLDYINYAYNSDLQQLKRRARDLDNLILSKYDYNDPLRNLLNMNDGNFLCIWKSKPPKYSSLEKWIVDITDYDGDVEDDEDDDHDDGDHDYHSSGLLFRPNVHVSDTSATHV